MRAKDVARLLRAQPFDPVRIRMTNGETHDIRHPEMAVVEPSWVTLYRYDSAGVAVDFSRLSLIHIHDIELIQARSQAG